MAEERKQVSRRSFLKGAITAGIIAGAPGTGLFIREASGAQPTPPTLPNRQKIVEPPNVTQDADVVAVAQNLYETAFDAAHDVCQAAAERFVKGPDNALNVPHALQQAGLRILSLEAQSRGKSYPAPGSIIKLRQLQLKQKGWHSHAVLTLGIYPLTSTTHWNVSW